MRLDVLGTMAYDKVKTVEGEVEGIGGSGIYAAISASQFGPVRLIGVVGSDFADKDIEDLCHFGVDVGLVRVVPGGDTFRWSAEYTTHERAITLETKLGVLQETTDFGKLSGDCLFLANYDPDVQLRVLSDSKYKFTAVDTMNLWIATKRSVLAEVFRRVNVIFINEDEACEFIGVSSPFIAANKLMAQYNCAVVLKRGKKGATLLCDSVFYDVPAYPVSKVVDTTGAGDSFAGGFLGYLCKTGFFTIPFMQEACLVGAVKASYAIERFGIEAFRSICDYDQRLRELRLG